MFRSAIHEHDLNQSHNVELSLCKSHVRTAYVVVGLTRMMVKYRVVGSQD